MHMEGPALENLLRWLEDTPSEFFITTESDGEKLHVAALISDRFRKTGTLLPIASLQCYDRATTPSDVNVSKMRSLACWFLHNEALENTITAEALFQIMDKSMPSLASEYPASQFIEDAERREELVRRILSDLSMRPEGETLAQAEDRLQSLDSSERKRMLAASRESEKRAREIREALSIKAARQAADKYTRE